MSLFFYFIIGYPSQLTSTSTNFRVLKGNDQTITPVTPRFVNDTLVPHLTNTFQYIEVCFWWKYFVLTATLLCDIRRDIAIPLNLAVCARGGAEAETELAGRALNMASSTLGIISCTHGRAWMEPWHHIGTYAAWYSNYSEYFDERYFSILAGLWLVFPRLSWWRTVLDMLFARKIQRTNIFNPGRFLWVQKGRKTGTN